MAVCFVYGNLVVAPKLNYFVSVFALMSFLTGLGREFLITLRDVAGDEKIGAKTLPMLLGSRKTVALAVALIYCGVILSFFPLFALPSFFLPYAALIVTADALLVAVIITTWRGQTQAALGFARNASLAALFVGTLAFASLAFA
ncbi:MAG: UbiA family prenyltransferase, partial [Candidatus Norongarragalinales archaeon]